MGKAKKNVQEVHRAGPLKQDNKKHKTGPHRSKGMVEKQNRGRVNSISSISGSRYKNHVKRSERRKQQAANRVHKIQAMMDVKSQLGGPRGAPLAITLIPLCLAANPEFTLKFILQNMKDHAIVLQQNGNTTHIRLRNGRNLTLITPPSNDFWVLLDLLKVADVSLFLLPSLEDIPPEGLTLLKAAKDQGMSTPFLGVTNQFSKTEEKSFIKSISRSLPIDKIYQITTPEQISTLLRMTSVTKIISPKYWGHRSSMLIESVEPGDNKLLHPSLASYEHLIKVTGIVKRRHLDPRRPVCIPGCGSWKILRIDVCPVAPETPKPSRFTIEEDVPVVGMKPTSMPPRFLYDPDDNDNPNDDIESQNDVEMDEDTDRELDDEDSDDGFPVIPVDSLGVEVKGKGKTGKKLPKGTSDYQADWLINSDSEESQNEIIGSDEELESEEDGDEEELDAYDEEEMDWDEEKKQMLIAKEARTEAEFPDWIDTPLDTPARVRFQKYRGLQSFKTSPWDKNENLPKDYSKIFQFQNYKHVYKVVVGKDAVLDGAGFIPIGQRVSIVLKPLSDEDVPSPRVVEAITNGRALCLFSLLRYETKMTVLNLHLNLTEAVKNKEELIFQVGFHRFLAKPILSEVSPGNKHKMLRFGQENSSCIATIYGPICFPPASVLAFKYTRRALIPIGNGSLFSMDPARIVIKRVLLSGYPYKVTGKNAVVRFMFFNREDIEWFKPVELRTRYGRRGHIREPLGTHGHMKCSFDGQIKSQDTMLMPLYKRVFPKWTYDENVPLYRTFD